MPGDHDARRRFGAMRSVLFRVAVAGVALTLALGGLEIVVRLGWHGREGLPVLRADSRAGWAWKPDLHRVRVPFAGGGFTFSSDHEGHRITYATDQATPRSRPVVLVVGDSFASGVGVADEETFAWRVARTLPDAIVNLAVVGYGSDQELIKVEEFFETHPGERVSDVFVVVFENDFRDVQGSRDLNLGRSKPRFRVHDGQLERPPYAPRTLDAVMDVSRAAWFASNLATRWVGGGPPRMEDGLEIVALCVTHMRHVVESHGARFHPLVYRRIGAPLPLTVTAWDDFVARTAVEDITDRVWASGAPPDPIGYDGAHWSAEGHRRVAQAVLDDLKRGSAPIDPRSDQAAQREEVGSLNGGSLTELHEWH